MILVTGGMGFIGMHTVRALLDKGEAVIPTSHRAWRVPEIWEAEVGSSVFPERLDVNNPHDAIELVRKHKPRAIIHFAGPPFAGTTLAADYATNLNGLLNLLEAGRIGEVERFVLASSNAVYGGIDVGPYHEEMTLPVASTNAVSAYKKAAEIAMFHYADRAGMSVAALRPPAVYGPLYYSLYNVMSRVCHATVKGTEPDYGPAGAPYEGDHQDMAYVKDVAEIFARAALQSTLGYRVYNCGSGQPASIQQLLNAAMEVIPGAFVSASSEPGSSRRGPDNYLDMTRVKNDLGYVPMYDVRAGVADYIRWLQTHSL